MADRIIVHGGRVHNLKNIDVEIPLNKLVAIAGVSGSGKSSLALGILYSEGSRRYLESLSTYTRRRMTEAARADVDEVLYIPPALALHQRPGVPGIRSTFGTGTELLNSIRLMFSRLASHKCPNGHYVMPSMNVAAGLPLTCPECGVSFYAQSAEDLSFNSSGACRRCGGTGIIKSVDISTLVPDETLSIDQGAVAPWNSLMWSLMTDVCREMGVRTDIPFKDLSDKEKDIVYHGPAEKKHILYKAKKTNQAGELDFTYYNAVYTVENALSKVRDEQGMKRVERFLKQDICPECHGSRLSEKAREPRIMGKNLEDICKLALSDLIKWVKAIPSSLPDEMKAMAESIIDAFLSSAGRLIDLGLGYLSLDRTSSTLSTGERQRMQLSRAVRNRTTGALYVLDEPSIGLHPANQKGLYDVMRDMIDDGNSVILVDHDTELLRKSDWLIELGPEAGENGGRIIAEGTISQIESCSSSVIGKFLKEMPKRIRSSIKEEDVFSQGKISLLTDAIHTVKPLKADIPIGRLTAVTGVSGSGKTTLILESLIPALEASIRGEKLPSHVKAISRGDINQVKLIDATPIGINVRSTVATYASIHDELRKAFARTPEAKAGGYKAGDFSYNTGRLRCPTCDGTGEISLDVQFLPDVDIPCPACHGSRYSKESCNIHYAGLSMPEFMDMDVKHALEKSDLPKSIKDRLRILESLGLGYLKLGEETPGLSGGEAQRLKLASEMGRSQKGSLFIFDEPSIGLHPLDVQNLITVFDTLIKAGATVIVIEHDLDIIRNADYIIDMGPGGGNEGGMIVAEGTPEEIKKNKSSITAKYI